MEIRHGPWEVTGHRSRAAKKRIKEDGLEYTSVCVLFDDLVPVPGFSAHGGHRGTAASALSDAWHPGIHASQAALQLFRMRSRSVFSIEFVQVLFSMWYSHTYDFVTLSS
jgi:hypothetical protein